MVGVDADPLGGRPWGAVDPGGLAIGVERDVGFGDHRHDRGPVRAATVTDGPPGAAVEQHLVDGPADGDGARDTGLGLPGDPRLLRERAGCGQCEQRQTGRQRYQGVTATCQGGDRHSGRAGDGQVVRVDIEQV